MNRVIQGKVEERVLLEKYPMQVMPVKKHIPPKSPGRTPNPIFKGDDLQSHLRWLEWVIRQANRTRDYSAMNMAITRHAELLGLTDAAVQMAKEETAVDENIRKQAKRMSVYCFLGGCPLHVQGSSIKAEDIKGSGGINAAGAV